MEKPMDFWRNGRTAGAKTGVVTTGGTEETELVFEPGESAG